MAFDISDYVARLSMALFRAGGARIEANKTTALLGADGVWEGTWTVDNFEQISLNVIAAQEGLAEVLFGIVKDGVDLNKTTLADADVIETFRATTRVRGGEGARFRPLVNQPGRAYRARYVNGSTPQTAFALQISAGNHQFPSSASPDNELLVTTTEQERDVFVAYGATNVATTSYACLIDVSDTTNFPHDRGDHVDVSATYLSIDRDATAAGAVRLGVIVRIDGTDADIQYFAGVSFVKSDERNIIRDRRYSPSLLKLEVSGGALVKVGTGFVATTTAVNTGVTLGSFRGAGTVTPAVGDVVVAFESTAGSYNASVSCTYHGNYAE